MSSDRINIYICGPTVYDKVHIGNLRPVLVFDIFVKLLEFLEKPYYYIQNITDIDDKIINRAKEQNTTEKAIASTYTKSYIELLKTLNVTMPTKFPGVVENIDAIQDFISSLIENGYAYKKDDGLYFSIEKSKGYGQLSNRKKIPKSEEQDFSLWKETTYGIKFESPWGKGRPGWHTECSALINKYFDGKTIDYHGGGIDLLFPHHENENAQYEAVNGTPITKKWVHVGKLLVDNSKMSKSLHNFVYADTFINENGIDTLRAIYFLSNPYRPLNLNNAMIIQAKQFVNKFEVAFKKASLIYAICDIGRIKKPTNLKFEEAIFNFDFSAAFFELLNILKNFNEEKTVTSAMQLICALKITGFSFTMMPITKEEISIYKKWKKLLANKNYHEADNLRKILIKGKLL